jgi:hypothetical protein
MATESQLRKIASVLVEHQDAFERLPTEDAQWLIQNPKKAIELMGNAISRILIYLDDMSLSTIEHFVASDHFKIGNFSPSFDSFGRLFEKRFLGMTETAESYRPVRRFDLARPASCSRITKGRGEPDSNAVPLSTIFALLVREKLAWDQQDKSEADNNLRLSTKLLHNGYDNVFFVKDGSGRMHAVTVRDVGYCHWVVNAFDFDSKDECREGSRIFLPRHE